MLGTSKAIISEEFILRIHRAKEMYFTKITTVFAKGRGKRSTGSGIKTESLGL
jgi:hypothetical protein